MRIPDKRSNRARVSKWMVITLMGFSLLILVWARIQAFSQETVVPLDDLIVAMVEKGSLTRDVRAPGTLVPIEMSFLAASSRGRVDDILLEAGDAVDVGTVIMVLDNPQLSQAVDAASYDLEVQRAALEVLEQRTSHELLSQRIAVADFESRHAMAELRREANHRLSRTGAVSSIAYNESVLLEEQLRFQHALEVERLESLPALRQAELASAQARILKAERQLALQQELVDNLHVKASAKGVLQEVLLEEGEQVMPGAVLARIARQDHLKARLRVQESQVKDVSKGQEVVISAGGKDATGVVRRIDPVVQQGVVLVDVIFTGDLLTGARPDLRVEGTIELEHVEDVLKLKRPVFSREFSSTSLFVIDAATSLAHREQVSFGRGSVDVIEVLSPLREGDRVVISDTNPYSDLDQIRLR